MSILHLFLLLTLFIPTVPLTGSCPVSIVPWYVSTISIGQLSPLPPGVSVTLRPDTQVLAITNTTETPLYLLRRDGSEMGYGSVPSVSPDYSTEFKVEREQVFRWQRELKGWVQYSPGGQPLSSLSLQISQFSGELFDPEYHSLNFGSTERRPADAVAPEPQSTFILFSYDEQTLKLPVTFSYTLNPEYETRYIEARRQTESCMNSVGLGLMIYQFGLPCFAVIGLITIVTVIVRLFRRRAQ